MMAEVFQSMHRVASEPLGGQAIDRLGPQILVSYTVSQHITDSDQNAMPDR